MNGQSRNFVLIFFLLFIINFDVQAAKFFRNKQTQTCLQYVSNSTQTCSPITLINCPVDRFGEISNLIKWNVIPVNPSQQILNSTENFIESFDNKLCLTTLANSAVQTCPCNSDVTQKWKPNGDGSLMSSSNDGKCLTTIGGNLVIDTCQNNSTSSSWEIYNVAPNAVNVYINPLFSGNVTQLFIDTPYTSSNLPQSIFTSPFSLEIPTGFTFEISLGKNDSIVYNSDIAQADPIKSLTSTITIKLKSGVVIYEQPAYFGNSVFFEIGANKSILTQTKAIMIGSVMVPKGVRNVIWQSPDFSGKNLGLFEPIANFTGVSVATSQAPVQSFDVASTSCTSECGSGGFCDSNNQCTCKQGFSGTKCDQCSSGFFGPNCQVCPTSCGDPTKFTCEDGISGTGKCKCKDGFTGEKCDQCLPGFFGVNCQACNCGNGVCDTQGNCSCNAGWANNGTNSCSMCATGFFNFEGDCKVCSAGCKSCEATTGKCDQCTSPLVIGADVTKCIPDTNKPNNCTSNQYFDTTSGQCKPCDSSCQACIGPGLGDCIKCQTPLSYFNGACVPLKDNNGRCQLQQTQQAFFVDNLQGACEACPNACTDCLIPGFNGQSTTKNVVCSNCIPGFVLDNGKCVKNCSLGKFVGNDSLTCIACNSACATCTGPLETQCISCTNKDFFAMNGICSSTVCPSSYVSVSTTCTKCHPDCTECSGPGINQCTKCSSKRPSLTKDGQCVEVCPMGMYLDDSGKCGQCDKDCSSCVGPKANQCLGCSSESNVLIGGSCSGTCPEGSKLIKSERLCHSQTDSSLVPVTVTNDNSTQKIFGLEWWHILIIALSALIFLILMMLLIRYCFIRRRKKKTDEFKEALDDNQVNKQMRSLYEIAPRLSKNKKNKNKSSLNKPEQPYYSNPKEFDIDSDGYIMNNDGTPSQIFNAPPSYDPKQGEIYWNDKKKEKLKHDKNSVWGNNWV